MVFYVSLRGWQVLQSFPTLKLGYVSAQVFLFLLLLSVFIFRDAYSDAVAKVVSFIAFTYMIVLIYWLLSFLLVDVIRISNYFIHFSPSGMSVFRLWALGISTVVIVIALVIGNYNFNHPRTVHLQLKVDKVLPKKHVRIVAASDLHLGFSIDKSMFKKYVSLINEHKPDLVLLAGDIADNATAPIVRQNMAEEFKHIQAPMGCYAISGNHEYFSENPFAMQKYLTEAGVTYLRDSVTLVATSFYVVGRDDKMNPNRKSLQQIMQNIDKSKPVILLDHQPFNLDEAAQNGVDLQLSGHTHNGQFFPGNLFVKRMYELAHGYLKKGKTHYYVSSGLGLWGPQYRIGTQSELVVIDLISN